MSLQLLTATQKEDLAVWSGMEIRHVWNAIKNQLCTCNYTVTTQLENFFLGKNQD